MTNAKSKKHSSGNTPSAFKHVKENEIHEE